MAEMILQITIRKQNKKVTQNNQCNRQENRGNTQTQIKKNKNQGKNKSEQPVSPLSMASNLGLVFGLAGIKRVQDGGADKRTNRTRSGLRERFEIKTHGSLSLCSDESNFEQIQTVFSCLGRYEFIRRQTKEEDDELPSKRIERVIPVTSF